MKKLLKFNIFLFVIFFIAVSCDEVSKQYANYYDAVNNGEIERGWMPIYMPNNIHDINIKYDLDTNETCIVFKFIGAFQIKVGNEQLNPADENNQNIILLKESRCFPKQLLKNINSFEILMITDVKSNNEYIGINRNKQSGWFYRR